MKNKPLSPSYKNLVRGKTHELIPGYKNLVFHSELILEVGAEISGFTATWPSPHVNPEPINPWHRPNAVICAYSVSQVASPLQLWRERELHPDSFSSPLVLVH